MKIIKKIIPIITLIVAIVALSLSIVAIQQNNQYEILGAYDVGLAEFLEDEIISMYHGCTDPTLRKEFFDENILQEFRDALRHAAFQEVKVNLDVKSNAPPGTGEYTYLRFSTSEKQYGFSVRKNVIVLSIDKEQPHKYKSNASSIVFNIIYKVHMSIINEEKGKSRSFERLFKYASTDNVLLFSCH